jgi:hypothetical protein
MTGHSSDIIRLSRLSGHGADCPKECRGGIGELGSESIRRTIADPASSMVDT